MSFVPTPAEIDMARQVADGLAGLVITFGLPLLLTWAVKKGLMQQRWATLIEAAAGAGYAAGNATGKPIDSVEYRAAAEAAVLAYAKSQGTDVLKAKGMTDNLTIEAGMARVSKLSNGMIGPNGSAVANVPPLSASAPVGAIIPPTEKVS